MISTLEATVAHPASGYSNNNAEHVIIIRGSNMFLSIGQHQCISFYLSCLRINHSIPARSPSCFRIQPQTRRTHQSIPTSTAAHSSASSIHHASAYSVLLFACTFSSSSCSHKHCCILEYLSNFNDWNCYDTPNHTQPLIPSFSLTFSPLLILTHAYLISKRLAKRPTKFERHRTSPPLMQTLWLGWETYPSRTEKCAPSIQSSTLKRIQRQSLHLGTSLIPSHHTTIPSSSS